MEDRESARYSQRALFFALVVSCLQPAISQCPEGTTGPDGGTCLNCVEGKYKSTIGSLICTDCVAGKYASSTIDSGLNGFIKRIAMSTLAQWTSQGIRMWKMGNLLQSCNTACGNSGLQCVSQNTSEEDTRAILGSIGKDFQILMFFNDFASPFCNSNFCYWQSNQFSSCSSFKSGMSRLCACGSSSVSGASSCTDCVAGKYSTTTNASVAGTCIDCGGGKYSGTMGVSTCSTCPVNTSSVSGRLDVNACNKCNAGTVIGVQSSPSPNATRDVPISSWCQEADGTPIVQRPTIEPYALNSFRIDACIPIPARNRNAVCRVNITTVRSPFNLHHSYDILCSRITVAEGQVQIIVNNTLTNILSANPSSATSQGVPFPGFISSADSYISGQQTAFEVKMTYLNQSGLPSFPNPEESGFGFCGINPPCCYTNDQCDIYKNNGNRAHGMNQAAAPKFVEAVRSTNTSVRVTWSLDSFTRWGDAYKPASNSNHVVSAVVVQLDTNIKFDLSTRIDLTCKLGQADAACNYASRWIVVSMIDPLKSYLVRMAVVNIIGEGDFSTPTVAASLSGNSEVELCYACAAGKYKTTVVSEECTDCPAGQYSTTTGASACVLCLPGEYKESEGSGECSVCPVNKTSLSGSSVLTDCECVPGYTGTACGTCSACVAGTYKTVTGTATCTDCNANTYSPSAATICVCMAGYTGPDGGTCLACEAGSYKATAGSAACTFCGVGFYSNATAAVSAESCVACPSDSFSVAGSAGIEWCYCNPGYRQTISHDACSLCDPGYYDNITDLYECSKCAGGLYSAAVGATGIETCEPCEAGTWSEEGSPTCYVCPAYSNSTRGSALITDCTCNPGATGSDGATCTACVAGKFKSSSGSAACTNCGADKYSASTGATSCTDCGAGKYSTTLGASTCTDCPECHAGTAVQTINHYLDRYSSVESKINEYYSLVVSSIPRLGTKTTTATYRPTFFESGGYNNKSFVRFSKTSSMTGHKFLDTTEVGTDFSNGLTIVAVVRFLQATGGVIWEMEKWNGQLGMSIYMSTTFKLCVMTNNNLVYTNDQYHHCLATSFPALVWMQVSYTYNPSTTQQLLTVKYTSTVTGLEVVLTKTGIMTMISGISGRKYALGYGVHQDCAWTGTDVEYRGVASCDRPEFDLAGFYFIQTLASVSEVSVLLRAISNSQQLYPSTSTPIVVQEFRNASVEFYVQQECTASSSVICSPCKLCQPGFYRKDTCGRNSANISLDTQCVLCPAMSYCPGDLNSSMIPCPANSSSTTGTSECLCYAGYTRPLQGYECISCAVGKYKVNVSVGVCTLCSVGKYSNALGSTSIDSCINCVEGTYADTAGSFTCKDCAAGKYSGAVGAATESTCINCLAGKYSIARAIDCLSCHGNSSSAAGSPGLTSCACNVGYTGANGGPCLPCVAGTYKTGTGNVICMNCGAGKYSGTQGATLASTCINCLGGKYSATAIAADNTTCLSCSASKYSTTIGASSEATCLICPGNSMSIAGSTICVCKEGYTGADGAQCLACSYSKYKTVLGSAICTACPENSQSPSGSSLLTNCTCFEGYTRANGAGLHLANQLQLVSEGGPQADSMYMPLIMQILGQTGITFLGP
jgi:hypothetical protein